jgi:hypothetical protein
MYRNKTMWKNGASTQEKIWMEMRCKGCLINMQDIQPTMKQVIKHMETKANKIYWK